MEHVFSDGLHFYDGVPSFPARGPNDTVLHHAPWCQDPHGERCNCGAHDAEDAVTSGVGSVEGAVNRMQKNGWDGEKWTTDRSSDFKFDSDSSLILTTEALETDIPL